MPSSSIALALVGGALIGGAASGLLLFNGRIAGISGIFGGLLVPEREETAWRVAFVLGLLAGGGVLLVADPAAFPAHQPRALAVLAAGGLLVGVGTKISNGCTSGHGVCGLSRRSPRSLAATLTFMTTGALTVYVVNHIVQGYLP
jgi:uncharacterized membrane protein YedE/YeeE